MTDQEAGVVQVPASVRLQVGVDVLADFPEFWLPRLIVVLLRPVRQQQRQGAEQPEQRQPGQHVRVARDEGQAVPVVLDEPGLVPVPLVVDRVGVPGDPEQAERVVAEVEPVREQPGRPGAEPGDDGHGQRSERPGGSPGAAPPGLHRVVGGHQRAGRDPHPVVIPADRRDEQPGQRGHQQPGDGVALAVEQRGEDHAGRADQDGGRDPGRLGTVDAAGEPGDEPVERLVAAQPVKPVRPPWKNKPWNHHSPESLGRMTKPSSTVKANPAQAIAACRNFLASSRYGIRISGTSLIPAAIPVPNPFHQRLLFFLCVRLAQVPDDQRHQDQVDLAQIHGAQDGFGPVDGGRAEQGDGLASSVLAVTEPAEGQPERREQRARMSTATDSCWDSHQGTNEMTAKAMAANGV